MGQTLMVYQHGFWGERSQSMGDLGTGLQAGEPVVSLGRRCLRSCPDSSVRRMCTEHLLCASRVLELGY